jgi:hypothetical protein
MKRDAARFQITKANFQIASEHARLLNMKFAICNAARSEDL